MLRSSTKAGIGPANGFALRQLSGWQRHAKINRVFAAFRSPRRQLISLIAVVLAIIWLSQAVVGILFRQSADPARLAIWLPLGFLGYSLWHFLKTISVKPDEPFDWTPTEIELLGGAPFTRTQLIGFRMSSILRAAAVKAICFTLLMIPDLNYWGAGCCGMWLALMLVDLIRVVIQIGCFGISKQILMSIRGLSYGLLTIWIGFVLWHCLTADTASDQLASPGGILFARQISTTMTEQITTQAAWLLLPFQPATQVILTPSIDAACCANLLLSLTLVMLLWVFVIVLDRFVDRVRRGREALACQTIQSKISDAQIRPTGEIGIRTGHSQTEPATEICDFQKTVRVPWRLRGVGSIAWRQLLGAWHYRGTLLISLGLPVFLCCLPMLAKHDPLPMLLNIVGGVVFYSFLLLPAALMLDFRRDANRLVVLKSLPISPLAVTIGQLAAPVLICLGFQWTVLGIAMINGAILVWPAIAAAILLFPICVLIFAAENLIFMFAPYRQKQEGLDVFLRTILTFTAKGISFAVAAAAMLAWAVACRVMGGWFDSPLLIAGILFGVGVWTLTTTMAALATLWLAKLYREFDPSLDAAGL